MHSRYRCSFRSISKVEANFVQFKHPADICFISLQKTQQFSRNGGKSEIPSGSYWLIKQPDNLATVLVSSNHHPTIRNLRFVHPSTPSSWNLPFLKSLKSLKALKTLKFLKYLNYLKSWKPICSNRYKFVVANKILVLLCYQNHTTGNLIQP